MSKPSVAIVILNWNTRHFLKRFLPSVLSTTYQNKEVYVVDNFSEDNSVSMLRSDFPEVRVIEMKSNVGYATGYNEALSVIEADYFFLVNSDIEVSRGFIEPVIQFMESDSRIGICQPKLLALENRGMFEYAGAAGGWIDQLGLPFARGRVLTSIERDNGQYDTRAKIFWASGACMCMKSKVFKETGGFYDYYYMHQEDIDICWRAGNIGYEVYVCPESVVYHIGGGTLSWQNHLKTFLTFRNNYILLSRNLPLLHSVPVISLRLFLDFGGCFFFFFKGEPGISKAMFRAMFAYFYWLILISKKKNRQPRGFLRKSGIYRSTILIPYFIRGRRTFAKIVQQAQND